MYEFKLYIERETLLLLLLLLLPPSTTSTITTSNYYGPKHIYINIQRKKTERYINDGSTIYLNVRTMFQQLLLWLSLLISLSFVNILFKTTTTITTTITIIIKTNFTCDPYIYIHFHHTCVQQVVQLLLNIYVIDKSPLCVCMCVRIWVWVWVCGSIHLNFGLIFCKCLPNKTTHTHTLTL